MKRTRAKDAHALEGTRPFTLTWVDDIFIFDDEPFLEVEVVVGKRGSEDSDDDPCALARSGGWEYWVEAAMQRQSAMMPSLDACLSRNMTDMTTVSSLLTTPIRV